MDKELHIIESWYINLKGFKRDHKKLYKTLEVIKVINDRLNFLDKQKKDKIDMFVPKTDLRYNESDRRYEYENAYCQTIFGINEFRRNIKFVIDIQEFGIDDLHDILDMIYEKKKNGEI